MKKIILLLILMLLTIGFSASGIAYAQSDENISEGVEEIIDNLDTSDIDELLSEFGSDELSIFGSNNI